MSIEYSSSESSMNLREILSDIHLRVIRIKRIYKIKRVNLRNHVNKEKNKSNYFAIMKSLLADCILHTITLWQEVK